MLKEYGSDFHFVHQFERRDGILSDFIPAANYYADGRMAIIHLFRTQGLERLWIPEYFCYDVVESLKKAGVSVQFYADYPESKNAHKTLDSIQKSGEFHCKDAVLLVNFLGIRSFRDYPKLSVSAIIEDHTHDLLGEWARNSKADWCIASLRKTLPIPEGGILWSPKGLALPAAPDDLEENDRIAAIRWAAMRLKARYLAGENVPKAAFRAGFMETEEFFDRAPVCSLDFESKQFLKSFGIQDWYIKKRSNWELLKDISNDGVHVVLPESTGCYPFSLVLLFDSVDERDRVRQELIAHQIYPAILWNVPNTTEKDCFKFSRCMLSIHCDSRYSAEDILQMKSIIESFL